MSHYYQISRAWAMPSKSTFMIPPIKELIERYMFGIVVDPLCGDSPFDCISNDIDPSKDAGSHTDALEFLKKLPDGFADTILFDPPYSPRQVAEHYHALSVPIDQKTTSSAFWGDLKKEIARVCKKGGIVISCGWNSGGIPIKYGFEIVEILLVAHGGWHNDTIVTVQKKGDKKNGKSCSIKTQKNIPYLQKG